MKCDNCPNSDIKRFVYGWFGSAGYNKKCRECSFESILKVEEFGELADFLTREVLQNPELYLSKR